jgi:hypothetical protein
VIVTLVSLVFGVIIFNKTEKTFVDTVWQCANVLKWQCANDLFASQQDYRF